MESQVEVTTVSCSPTKFLLNPPVPSVLIDEESGSTLQGIRIIYSSSQMYAYADDICLVARNIRSLREVFQLLKAEGDKIGLTVNESKTKYMNVSPNGNAVITQDLEVEGYRFEKFIKARRIEWLGHISKNAGLKNAEENLFIRYARQKRTSKKTLGSGYRKRPEYIGRHKVEKESRVLREQWIDVVKEAKAHPGL
uniref:Reverse transcriptase domain-containing protein n=1 Tax=Rhodnius prolixus TaxID=13249 RepID=T1HB04_RHOPR